MEASRPLASGFWVLDQLQVRIASPVILSQARGCGDGFWQNLRNLFGPRTFMRIRMTLRISNRDQYVKYLRTRAQILMESN